MRAPASPRAALLSGWLALAVLAAGLGGWAGFARLTAAVLATGHLAPAGNSLVVQHAEGGPIETLAVAEGDRVREGQLLARLDGGALASELALARDRLNWLNARRARLTGERDGAAALPQADASAAALAGEARLFAARRASRQQEDAQLAERQAQTGAQIAGLRAQSAAAARERALVQEDLATQRALRASGLTQAAAVSHLERELARLDGQLGALAAALAQAEGQRAEIGIARLRLADRLRTEAMTELPPLEAEIAGIEERQRDLIRRLDALEIRAPSAGIVQGLTLTTPRAVLRPAEALLTIVPQSAPPVVTASIAPRDIDEIRPGAAARLRLTALAGRSTPELAARLTKVSPDAFRDPQTGQAFYRAEIALDPGEAARLGVPLVPGMPVEVVIATGSHSPAAYLLKPFADYFARAFHES